MHGRVVAVDHARAELHELVDDLVHAVLVARDQGAGEDHRVEFVDRNVAVVAVGDAAKGSHRLALRSGAHVDELVVLHVVGLLEVDDGALGDVQVAQIGGDGHVAHHRTADEDDLAAVLVRRVDDLLHAVHMRREARDDDLAARLREGLVERGADRGLRLDESGHLGVGGIHHQQIHALLADLAELDQIGDAVVEGQLVELDVAGVDQRAGRGLDVHGQRVGDGVGHGDELEVVGADLHLVAALHGNHHRVEVVLLALRLDEGERELGADQRDVRAQLEQVGHAADVVLVAMREHERLDLVETVLDVVEVGQDQVDARLLLLGEQHAAVDEQQVAVVLDHVHVAADFAQAAERHDAQRALAVLRRGDEHAVLLRRGRRLRAARAAPRPGTAGTGAAGALGGRTRRLRGGLRRLAVRRRARRGLAATGARGTGRGLVEGLDRGQGRRVLFGFALLAGVLGAALACGLLCGFLLCCHFLVGFPFLGVPDLCRERGIASRTGAGRASRRDSAAAGRRSAAVHFWRLRRPRTHRRRIACRGYG